MQVSAPVYFFVNYTGTILDTEGDVAGRGGSFLNGTAIGHYFFGAQTVGSNGTYALAAHEQIANMFRSRAMLELEARPDCTTQILIETATTVEGTDLALINNEEYGEANARIILDATLSWISKKSEVDLFVSTGNGQTRANADQLTAENYSIRWYVAKEQNDAWHIDGVLTANTTPLVVTKSFAGLTETQIESLLSSYAIDLWIRGNDEAATYMTLNTTDSYTTVEGGVTTTHQGIAGQYDYKGYDSATQTASWEVRLLIGEHVTLSEKNHELSNYVASAYSVIDGDGGSIHTGTKTGYDVSVDESNAAFDVVGGTNGEVAFSNTYTEIGKGSLSLLKKNSATGQIMQGVVFGLFTDAACTSPFSSATTSASGRADFMNLDPGTYYLKETSAPAGFKESSDTYKVEVSVPDNEIHAQVSLSTLGGTPITTGTDTILYTIENTPDQGTIIVEKQFKDITTAEVKALYNSYAITLTGSSNNYTLTLDGLEADETKPTYVSADGLRYTWVISHSGSEHLTVAETGYASDSYIDT